MGSFVEVLGDFTYCLGPGSRSPDTRSKLVIYSA